MDVSELKVTFKADTKSAEAAIDAAVELMAYANQMKEQAQELIIKTENFVEQMEKLKLVPEVKSE